MKVDLNSHFPHPVLSEGSDDFENGSFDLIVSNLCESTNGDVEIDYALVLVSADIKKLLMQGVARVGAFIRCQDTFYSELRIADEDEGTWHFDRGALYGRVEVKPLIWLTQSVDSWDAGSLNPEFGSVVSIRKSEVIGLANDVVFSIGQDKLRKFESIFELVRSDKVTEGQLELQLSSDSIRILAPGGIFKTIGLMRGTSQGKPILLSAVYLPVVMEVLENMRGSGSSGFENLTWYRVIAAKCDHLGIDFEQAPLLESAQRLLGSPVEKLGTSFMELTQNG